MELIFNELSLSPLSTNKALANERVAQFIECYKSAFARGFKKIRFWKQFHEIEIAENYTLSHWLAETNQRQHKELLLFARAYPFIEEDTEAEDVYLHHLFYFGNAEIQCAGLAAAHIYDTLSISYKGAHLWETNSINIQKTNTETGVSETVRVANVFSAFCFDNSFITGFIERIREVCLVETQILPAEKPIHFRPDHGIDILQAFAKRLINSPYVESVINSLPWNKSSNFIRRVYPNGHVELVLHWTDKGLGMVIQTTGRNQRETKEIARILEKEYT